MSGLQGASRGALPRKAGGRQRVSRKPVLGAEPQAVFCKNDGATQGAAPLRTGPQLVVQPPKSSRIISLADKLAFVAPRLHRFLGEALGRVRTEGAK